MPAFFVTGTDTEIGKTTIAAGLLHAARSAGLSTAAAKPVASGCEPTAQGLRNGDALVLLGQCSLALAYEQVNPLAFAPAIAPHLAAREAGVELSAARLHEAVREVLALQADFTLVEGAGGWRVPLLGRENLSDLARLLALPVVLVVGVRLGCINHALLSAEAILGDGLALAGWVANVVDPATSRLEENLATLAERLPAPCLGRVPRLEEATPRPWPHTSTCGPWVSGYKQRAVHNQRAVPSAGQVCLNRSHLLSQWRVRVPRSRGWKFPATLSSVASTRCSRAAPASPRPAARSPAIPWRPVRPRPSRWSN